MSSREFADDEGDEALLALDALDAEEQLDAELRFGTFPPAAAEVGAVLGERVARPPADELRARVLAAARSARRPGRPSAGVVASSPADGFAATVADVHELLRSLTADEWLLPVHQDHGSARNLIAHLIGVERLSARWLDPTDDVPELPDHVASTRGVVTELASHEPVGELADLWRSAALAVRDAASTGDPARVISFHDLRSDLDGFLAMRTFELWAHSMDISLATGRPMLALDDGRMLTLSRQLMRVVPLALARSRVTVPDATVRFVLTGPSGGSYDVPLRGGRDVERPAATIVATAHDLCKLATSRLAPEALHPWLEGDDSLAGLVLSGLDALALD